MKPIQIRDLETGQVLVRHGATAHELLISREPERDEGGNAILDDEGQLVPSTFRRFVRLGTEPRAWKEANAAKQPVDGDEPEAAEADPALTRKRNRKRGA